MNVFRNNLHVFRDNPDQLKDKLLEVQSVLRTNILAIPCDLESSVLRAGSPFTAFIEIRAICETSTQRLALIDPYVGPGVLYRYFQKLHDEAIVTVVTTKRSGNMEFNSFIDVSRLFAKERGADKYQLKFHSSLHDRYLTSDDTLYHLGGSLKDAGMKSDYTISTLSGDTDAWRQVQALVEEATEGFGPRHRDHP